MLSLTQMAEGFKEGRGNMEDVSTTILMVRDALCALHTEITDVRERIAKLERQPEEAAAP